MKEFMTKLIKVLSNILLTISIIGLVASVILMALNGAVDNGMIEELQENQFFQWLTLDKISTVTVYLGAIVSAGGIAKISGSTLKRIAVNSKSELEKQAEVYEGKIEKIKEESIDAMVVLANSVNQLTDNQKKANLTNRQILEVMLITARRNIGSNLVTDEDKRLYKLFIKNVEGQKEPKLENIYMTLIEEKPEIKVQEQVEKTKEEKESVKSYE